MVLDREPATANETKSGMWTGGALAYSKHTGSVITCAHRCKQRFHKHFNIFSFVKTIFKHILNPFNPRYQLRGILSKAQIKDELGIRGKCWSVSNSGVVQALPHLCTPLTDTNTDRCSAGLSVTYFR